MKKENDKEYDDSMKHQLVGVEQDTQECQSIWSDIVAELSQHDCDKSGLIIRTPSGGCVTVYDPDVVDPKRQLSSWIAPCAKEPITSFIGRDIAIGKAKGAEPTVVVDDVSLYPGLTVILGRAGTGKSTLLTRIAKTCQAADVTYTLANYKEPVDSMVEEHGFKEINRSSDALIMYMCEQLMSIDSNVIVIDSLSDMYFKSWSGYNTISGGINVGFFSWCDALEWVAMKLEKTLVVTVNPSVPQIDGKADVVEVGYEILKGKVATVVQITQRGIGRLNSRPLGNGRVDVAVSFLEEAEPIVGKPKIDHPDTKILTGHNGAYGEFDVSKSAKLEANLTQLSRNRV